MNELKEVRQKVKEDGKFAKTMYEKRLSSLKKGTVIDIVILSVKEETAVEKGAPAVTEGTVVEKDVPTVNNETTVEKSVLFAKGSGHHVPRVEERTSEKRALFVEETVK